MRHCPVTRRYLFSRGGQEGVGKSEDERGHSGRQLFLSKSSLPSWGDQLPFMPRRHPYYIYIYTYVITGISCVFLCSQEEVREEQQTHLGGSSWGGNFFFWGGGSFFIILQIIQYEKMSKFLNLTTHKIFSVSGSWNIFARKLATCGKINDRQRNGPRMASRKITLTCSFSMMK